MNGGPEERDGGAWRAGASLEARRCLTDRRAGDDAEE